MPKISSLITRIIVSVVSLVVVSLPIAPLAFADMTPPDADGNSCFIVGSDQPGNHKPVGADAGLFTYNCKTNLWESSHYTYSPATGQRTAKDPVVYTYNPSTGNYDTQSWDFSASRGDYILTSHSAATPPAGATVVGAPAPAATSINNTGAGSNNTINDNGGTTAGSSINGTGANSNNTIGGNSTNNTSINNQNNATLNNQLNALATTGNAIVLANTTGGDANSGNAQDIDNVVNMLQSTGTSLSGNTVTFVANIDGDVNGDMLLDPSVLGSNTSNSQLGDNNLTLNNQTNASINNNINLAANSGDATVADNTTAGNATSGSATAIANVVNIINSAVSSGRSFLGVININGNLNGDILIPQNFIDQLIADNVPTVTISNTGADSNNTVNTNDGSNTTKVTNTNNQGITNNVNSTATTGQADVTGNTTAGNATSGNATNNITAFNLTGSNVIGSNDLLVFVNVTGKWVGMIVNAPPGTTAAELGGGITQNTSAGNNNTTIDNKTGETITNNITTNSKSGNALVKDNTTAGNATSGNAKNAVNLLNVENSNLSLSGWFGILFINVFGTWNGSFGVNTAAGDPVASTGGGSAFANTGSITSPSSQFFSFVARGGNSGNSTSSTGSSSGSGGSSISNTGAGSVNGVLAANTLKAPTPVLQSAHGSFSKTAVIIGGLTLLAIIGDSVYSQRRQARKHANKLAS